MNEIMLAAGTVVKLNGIPFELKEDAVVLGTQTNYELATE